MRGPLESCSELHSFVALFDPFPIAASYLKDPNNPFSSRADHFGCQEIVVQAQERLGFYSEADEFRTFLCMKSSTASTNRWCKFSTGLFK